MKIDTNTLSSNILKHKHDLQKNIENIWNQLKQGIDNIINKNLPFKQSSATAFSISALSFASLCRYPWLSLNEDIPDASCFLLT
jgi:hypothetical protein